MPRIRFGPRASISPLLSPLQGLPALGVDDPDLDTVEGLATAAELALGQIGVEPAPANDAGLEDSSVS